MYEALQINISKCNSALVEMIHVAAERSLRSAAGSELNLARIQNERITGAVNHLPLK